MVAELKAIYETPKPTDAEIAEAARLARAAVQKWRALLHPQSVIDRAAAKQKTKLRLRLQFLRDRWELIQVRRIQRKIARGNLHYALKEVPEWTP